MENIHSFVTAWQVKRAHPTRLYRISTRCCTSNLNPPPNKLIPHSFWKVFHMWQLGEMSVTGDKSCVVLAGGGVDNSICGCQLELT